MSRRVRAASDLADLIAAVYEGAFNPSRWPAFLMRIERAIGGYGTGLLIADPRSPASSLMVSLLPPEFDRSYNEHYHSRNPWLGSEGRSFLLENEAGVGESVVSTSELRRTEFYSDWLWPQRVQHTIGMMVMPAPSFFVLLSSLREASRGPFTDRDVRLFTRLRPHLRRAVEAQRRNAPDLQARNASLAALDRLPYGWIVADAAARAVHLNATAKLMIDRGELDLRNPSLRALIVQIAKTGFGGDLDLPRRAGRPLYISGLPLRTPQSAPFSAGMLVGILISDPDQAPVSDAERLRRFWRLSPAEAKLAAELVRGLDLAAAAERLGITRTTARNQLGSILSKTGAHRQTELLRLLTSAPPQFRLD